MKIRINISEAAVMLAAVRNALTNPKSLMRSIALAAAEEVKRNFRELDAKRSRYKHKFYIREGEEKTEYAVEGDRAAVIVRSVQMAHKLRGGEIRARNVKYLSIPVSDVAKERALSPSLWRDKKLFLLKSGNGNLFLAEKWGRGAISLHFLLKRSVTQRAHPEVIPDRSRIIAAVRKGIADARFLADVGK